MRWAQKGAMRHVLTVQQKTGAPDEGGGFSDITWQDIPSFPNIKCALAPNIPNAEFANAQIETSSKYVITTRFRTDISADMRLVDPESGTIYEIDRLYDPDKRRAWTVIYATRHDAD